MTALSQRLFFALWPSDALRECVIERVASILKDSSARPIAPQNLHMTLAFLGSVGAAKIADVIAAGETIVISAFTVRLDQAEVWSGANVLCLTPTQTPQSLTKLVEHLRFNLLERHVEADAKQFRAHVTIARDARKEGFERSIEPIDWTAMDFVLVESIGGRDSTEYRVARRWPLRP